MRLHSGLAAVAIVVGLCSLGSVEGCGSTDASNIPVPDASLGDAAGGPTDGSGDGQASDGKADDVAANDTSKPDGTGDVTVSDVGHDATGADVTADTVGADVELDVALDVEPDVNFSYDGGPTTAWSKLPAKCAAAAEKGVAWLVAQQKADGSWGSNNPYMLAGTGLAIVKLEAYALENGKSPFRPTFQYQSEVIKGLDFLLKQLTTTPVGAQFDSNGNGLGVTLTGQTNYVRSIVLMALTAGGGFDQVVNAPGSPIDQWTYLTVAQDMVDYFSECQVVGATQGGWRYQCPSANSDNSVTQYVSLGLEYAEHPDYAFQCVIPQAVRTNLWTWVGAVQHMTNDADYGGSGYTNSANSINPYKTGALLQELALLKQDVSTVPVQAALQYLDAHWAGPIAGNPAAYMAMWAIMKGLVAQGVTTVGTHDWYQEYCDVLVAQQNADGSWPMAQYDNAGSDGVLSTTWALLILEKVAPANLY